MTLALAQALPAAAEPDTSFEGGSAADFQTFLEGVTLEAELEGELETFGQGVMALVLERYPPAAGLTAFERLALLQAAFDQAGETMVGLSYREIHEYGKAISSRSVQGATRSTPELTEEELLACLREHVLVAFIGLEEPVNPFYSDQVRYTLENQLDRAISQINMDLIYRSEGRSVPWATVIASDVISGGAEPGERHELGRDIDVYGWEEKPEPLIWELQLNDILDADQNSFMRDFGQEICRVD
jgi:hypothetical protein